MGKSPISKIEYRMYLIHWFMGVAGGTISKWTLYSLDR